MVYSSIKLQSHASVLEMDTCRTARSSDWSDLFILSSHSSLAKAHHRTGVGADPPLAPPSLLPSTLTLTLTLIQGTHQDLRRVTLEGGLEGCLEGRGRGSGRGRGHEGEALGGRGYNPPSSFLPPLPSSTLSSPKSTPPPCSPRSLQRGQTQTSNYSGVGGRKGGGGWYPAQTYCPLLPLPPLFPP